MVQRMLAIAAIALTTSAARAPAQTQPGMMPPARPGTAATIQKSEFKPEEIEALVAPIALYPDSLLSQVLMASTYPVEVVQAERWIKANKALKGDAMAKELEKQTWDPAVKSLVNFPETLTMMSEKLDWTVKLGDAFLAQQKPVMEAIQKLRAKAQAAGNLNSNEQMKVTSTAAQTGGTNITIESANPQVVYVPTYNPTVVYGSWPYPYYPPYYYYPPSYTPSPGLAFGAGMTIGLAWGYAWGHCDWDNNDCDIDIDRNTEINTNIDRDKYKAEFDKRQQNRQEGGLGANRENRTADRGTGDRAANRGKGTFQHDPSHRQGVAYRDQSTAQRFGGSSSIQQTQARDAYRGRAEAGRADIARGGANSFQGAGGANRPAGGTPSYNRPAQGAQNRAAGNTSYNRPSNTGTRSNAYNGINQGGGATRNYSQRGASSRGSYGGGGGARGGGGGRGGGRR